MSTSILPDNVTIRPTELDVASIIVRDRQRGIDAAHVSLLRNSIRDTDKQIVPIAVSERADGKLVLIDGAHRLEAAKQDGRATIRAEVYTNLAEDQESVLEFVTNRARKDLSLPPRSSKRGRRLTCRCISFRRKNASSRASGKDRRSPLFLAGITGKQSPR